MSWGISQEIPKIDLLDMRLEITDIKSQLRLPGTNDWNAWIAERPNDFTRNFDAITCQLVDGSAVFMMKLRCYRFTNFQCYLYSVLWRSFIYTHPLSLSNLPSISVFISLAWCHAFRITGHLWGESTQRWIPLTNTSNVEFWYFLCVSLNMLLNK